MGTWQNPQKGFTVSERFPNVVADDCVRVTRRNHHAPRQQVTKKAVPIELLAKFETTR
ncbi:MAG: hypothetical protein ABF915_10720 [Schleiferilactobacillus harbinensis]